MIYENDKILRLSNVYGNALVFSKSELSGSYTIRLLTATIYEDSVEVDKCDSIVLEKTNQPGYIPVSTSLGPCYFSDLSQVIIKSSTEGSIKKFKLSVDDSGTISATEVTA